MCWTLCHAAEANSDASALLMCTTWEHSEGKQMLQELLTNMHVCPIRCLCLQKACTGSSWYKLVSCSHEFVLSWQVYERAIANIPPAPEKRYWQRYIYLWINYALFEELEAQDMDRTREVYRACLKLIPHKAFTFAKVLFGVCVSFEQPWILYLHVFHLTDGLQALGRGRWGKGRQKGSVSGSFLASD